MSSTNAVPSGGQPGSDASAHPPLPMAEVGMANKRAQIRGTISGISVGLVAALAARNILKLSPNATVLTGLLSGTTSGYVSSRYQLQQGLADVERSEKLRRGVIPGQPSSGSSAGRSDAAALRSELRAADETHFEAGVGGMHEFVDRGATTRGDH